MNAMTQVTARKIQWFAVRMKPNASGGPRTAIVDIEKEQYTNRVGQKAWRKVKGTGNRVFLPEHLMRQAGFEVFLPVKKVLRIKNRFTKEKHLVAVPLLADWMFVGLPIGGGECGRVVPNWKRLMELDVVAGVMGTGGKPIQLSDATVMGMMRRYSGRNVSTAVTERILARYDFNVGQLAKVLSGPFEGFDFKIDEIHGRQAKGLVNIFGRETPLLLELAGLAPQ
jgi:transcription antitermination factor NusG